MKRTAQVAATMQVGIHAHGPDAATAAGVARAVAVGADAVCLGLPAVAGAAGVAGAPDAPDATVAPPALREAVQRYRDAGVAVGAAHAGSFSDALMLGAVGAGDDAERPRLWRTIEVMAQVGIPGLLFYTTVARPAQPEAEQQALADFTAFCEQLAGHAAAHGVNIACHPWVSRPELIHGYHRLIKLCRRIEQPAFGITYCPGGALAGDDMHAVREALLPRIHFAHLRDQIGDYRSFTEVFPGTGEVAAADLLLGLRDAGYTGLVCPEHLGAAEPGQDLEAEAVRYARQVLAG